MRELTDPVRVGQSAPRREKFWLRQARIDHAGTPGNPHLLGNSSIFLIYRESNIFSFLLASHLFFFFRKLKVLLELQISGRYISISKKFANASPSRINSVILRLKQELAWIHTLSKQV